jgi:Rrf2 family protein
MASTQYATTLHLLILLAAEPDESHTSVSLAQRLDTNPVVIRRLVASLARAGMVQTRRGAGGGVSLAGDPAALTLGQVADVIEADMTFEVHSLPTPSDTDFLNDAALSAVEAQRRELHTASIVELDRISLKDITQAATLRADLVRLVAEGKTNEEIRNGYRIENGRLVPMDA